MPHPKHLPHRKPAIHGELPSFGALPPWCPIPTPAAARYLGVHPKTLLRWHRRGIGPQPEPRGRYTGNVIYWMPAKLRSWWESRFAPPGRTVDEIVFEWGARRPPGLTLIGRFPPGPAAASCAGGYELSVGQRRRLREPASRRSEGLGGYS